MSYISIFSVQVSIFIHKVLVSMYTMVMENQYFTVIMMLTLTYLWHLNFFLTLFVLQCHWQVIPQINATVERAFLDFSNSSEF